METKKVRGFSAIGIDLGTTYSCVGFMRDEKIHIVRNDHGNKKLPSYVSFTDDGCLVGDAAFSQAATNPHNTIFDVKRLLGVRFDDFEVSSRMAHWPFEILNVNGVPKIKVTSEGEEKILSTEDISALILAHLKEMAHNYLHEDVSNVVLTVPANFNDFQRQSMIQASRAAGLNVIRIISDPIAVALAYELDQKGEDERNVLIFDLGGGTFDVSVLCVAGGVFEVKSTSGDTHLGGEDFDSRLVAHFVDEFRRKHRKDPSGSKRALRRLRTACERAKRTLSSSTHASIEVDALFDGVDFYSSISRARFEELCGDLLLAVVMHIQRALDLSHLEKSEISEVLLVGGSSRIPEVKEIVTRYFGKEPRQTVDPDEAVVIGAVLQAAAFQGVDYAPETALSIGIEAPGALMTVVVPRDTPLPVRKNLTYTTYRDYQSTITLRIFEGERALAHDNFALGVLNLEGIPPQPRGVPKIDITFEVDAAGLLSVKAVDRGSERVSSLSAVTSKSRLTKEEVEKAVRDASDHREEDDRERERIASRDLLETCVASVKAAIDADEVVQLMSPEDREWYMHVLHEELLWLQSNQAAGRSEYVRRTVDLQILYLSVIVDVFHGELEPCKRFRYAG